MSITRDSNNALSLPISAERQTCPQSGKSPKNCDILHMQEGQPHTHAEERANTQTTHDRDPTKEQSPHKTKRASQKELQAQLKEAQALTATLQARLDLATSQQALQAIAYAEATDLRNRDLLYHLEIAQRMATYIAARLNDPQMIDLKDYITEVFTTHTQGDPIQSHDETCTSPTNELQTTKEQLATCHTHIADLATTNETLEASNRQLLTYSRKAQRVMAYLHQRKLRQQAYTKAEYEYQLRDARDRIAYWQRQCREAENTQQDTLAGLTLTQLKDLWHIPSTQLSITQKMLLPLIFEHLENGLEQGEPQPYDDAGRRRINCEAIATRAGCAGSTVSRTVEMLKTQLPQFFDIQSHKESVPGVKKPVDRLYAKALDPDLLKHPQQIIPSELRKHGGDRYTCTKCGSRSYKITTKRKTTQIIECLDCHHSTILSEKETSSEIIVHDNTGKTPTTKKNQLDFSSEDPTSASKKFSDQACNLHVVITSDPPMQVAGVENQNTGCLEELTEWDTQEWDDVREAAALLLAIAGDDENHIEMSPDGQKKYYNMKPPRPLTQADLVDHLQGGKARGSRCSYRNGMTRALAFDADNAESWELLEQAARKLAGAEYQPILEHSPAHGGHHWIIFDELVDARAARAAVVQIAPELEHVKEYWPGPAGSETWNRVRLPGGHYSRSGPYVAEPIDAWCVLQNVLTGEWGSGGVSAARLLLSSLSSATLVPELLINPETEVQDEREEARKVARPEPQSQLLQARASEASEDVVDPEVDAAWIAKNGSVETTTYYFAILPGYAAQCYNQENSLEEVRPLERNGMALSPNGSERTASTSYHNDRYYDHSQHGKRSDGTCDSGDALELAAKVQGIPKAELFRMSTGQIVKRAKAALVAAAEAGEPLPRWFFEPKCIITRAGRRKYAELLAERGKHGERGTVSRLEAGGDDLPGRSGHSTPVSARVGETDRDAGEGSRFVGEGVLGIVGGIRGSQQQGSGDGTRELCRRIRGADCASDEQKQGAGGAGERAGADRAAVSGDGEELAGEGTGAAAENLRSAGQATPDAPTTNATSAATCAESREAMVLAVETTAPEPEEEVDHTRYHRWQKVRPPQPDRCGKCGTAGGKLRWVEPLREWWCPVCNEVQSPADL